MNKLTMKRTTLLNQNCNSYCICIYETLFTTSIIFLLYSKYSIHDLYYTHIVCIVTFNRNETSKEIFQCVTTKI